MAQTIYDPRSAQAYANALLTQGDNPLVDWFTNSQGGGLANWVSNQGKQIGNRIKNDLAYKIEHDDSLIDRVRTARNEGRDLRKELLDGYFINPYDETLNTAVDNLETKNTNRLNEAIAESLMSKINSDAYKGGNVLEEAKNLGWNNLTKEQEKALKKYEQEALTKRYEEPLRKQIASQLIENPTYDPTGLVQEYNKLYGTQFNPADFLDTTSDKTKKYTDATFADLSGKIISNLNNINNPEDFDMLDAQIDHMMALNPGLYEKLLRMKEMVKTKKKEDTLDYLGGVYNFGIEKGQSKAEILAGIMQYAREANIPQATLKEFLVGNNELLGTLSSEAFVAGAQERIANAKSAIAGLKEKYKDEAEYNFLDPKNKSVKIPEYIRRYTSNNQNALNESGIIHKVKDLDKFLAWFAYKQGASDEDKFKDLMNQKGKLIDAMTEYNKKVNDIETLDDNLAKEQGFLNDINRLTASMPIEVLMRMQAIPQPKLEGRNK